MICFMKKEYESVSQQNKQLLLSHVHMQSEYITTLKSKISV